MHAEAILRYYKGKCHQLLPEEGYCATRILGVTHESCSV